MTRTTLRVAAVIASLLLSGCIDADGQPAPGPEAGSYEGELHTLAPIHAGTVAIGQAGQEHMILRMTLSQPMHGIVGPVLVFVDITDPSGATRVDEHAEGGIYLILDRPVEREFRFEGVPAGDWRVDLELWEGSVPVEFTIDWQAGAQ